jgi:hypothetical protein
MLRWVNFLVFMRKKLTHRKLSTSDTFRPPALHTRGQWVRPSCQPRNVAALLKRSTSARGGTTFTPYQKKLSRPAGDESPVIFNGAEFAPNSTRRLLWICHSPRQFSSREAENSLFPLSHRLLIRPRSVSCPREKEEGRGSFGGPRNSRTGRTSATARLRSRSRRLQPEFERADLVWAVHPTEPYPGKDRRRRASNGTALDAYRPKQLRVAANRVKHRPVQQRTNITLND